MSKGLIIDLSDANSHINDIRLHLIKEEKSLQSEFKRFKIAEEEKKYSEERLERWHLALVRRLKLIEFLKDLLNVPNQLLNGAILNAYLDGHPGVGRAFENSTFIFQIEIKNRQIRKVFDLNN